MSDFNRVVIKDKTIDRHNIHLAVHPFRFPEVIRMMSKKGDYDHWHKGKMCILGGLLHELSIELGYKQSHLYEKQWDVLLEEYGITTGIGYVMMEKNDKFKTIRARRKLLHKYIDGIE